MFLIPTIEVRSFDEFFLGEFEVSRLDEYIKRPKAPLPFLSMQNQFKFAAILSPNIFRLEKFRFEIEEYCVEVQIYVHDKAFDQSNKLVRDSMLNEYVKQRAAWFFSYGSRIKKEKGPRR